MKFKFSSANNGQHKTKEIEMLMFQFIIILLFYFSKLSFIQKLVQFFGFSSGGQTFVASSLILGIGYLAYITNKLSQ